MQTSSGEVSAAGSPAGTPTQAPKYGTLIPNRIFVGGIAANVSTETTENELKQFFAAYGAVKDCKIIADRAGVSKGYGFVTFECQEDAEKIIKNEADNLVFKDRKLNIGPAIRKQAFPGPRMYEPSLSPGSIMYTNGVPYTFQNGMAIFHAPEGYSVPTQPQPAAYPVMMSPGTSPMYITQPGYAAYQSPAVGGAPSQWGGASAAAAAAAAQWRWAPQSPMAASQYMYHPSMLHPGGEMIYTQQAAQTAAYQTTDEASMLEAAMPPSEGSSTVELSSPQHHYAESTTSALTPEHQQAQHFTPHHHHHHHQATTPIMTKGSYPYTTLKCHIPTWSNVFATPPSTPSPMSTPIKVLPQSLFTATHLLTKEQLENDDLTRASLLSPPQTPQSEL